MQKLSAGVAWHRSQYGFSRNFHILGRFFFSMNNANASHGLCFCFLSGILTASRYINRRLALIKV